MKMVVVVGVVAFVVGAVVVVADAVVVMMGMVVVIIRVEIINRRIDIFECWFLLNVGDIGGVGIGCIVNSEFCGSSLVHHHN